jgi:hypothetical protein
MASNYCPECERLAQELAAMTSRYTRAAADIASLEGELAETRAYWEECQVEHNKRNLECQVLRELLGWIEANTTLHKSVETGYYVDHYEANVLYDENLHQRNVGESIEDAIRAAIDAGKGE